MKAWFVLLLLCGSAFGQHRERVIFGADCETPTCSMYRTEFRDALAKSPRYIEAKEPFRKFSDYAVTAVTFEFTDGRFRYIAISTAFLIWPAGYINHTIQLCTEKEIPLCVKQEFSAMDDSFSNLAPRQQGLQ